MVRLCRPEFPRQPRHALWGFLGKLKKDVGDERSGATMSGSHCLLSFVFCPAFPIILPESPTWGMHSVAGTPEGSA